MNTSKQLTKRPQSLFTLVCEFSSKTLYFGTHKKFTFRGDDLTKDPQQEVKFLKIKRAELLENYTMYKCTIYDNRSISNLPFCIVKQWYMNNLIHDNETLLYRSFEPKEINFSESFLERMKNENFITEVKN